MTRAVDPDSPGHRRRNAGRTSSPRARRMIDGPRRREAAGKFGRYALVTGMFLLSEEHIVFFRRRPTRLVYHRVDN
jgi:hypothetical protein